MPAVTCITPREWTDEKNLFWRSDRIPLTSATDVNFMHPSGPPLHAKYPGVFDRTGGDLHRNGGRFGLCLVIIWERMPLRARIGEGVNSEKLVVFGDSFLEWARGFISF